MRNKQYISILIFIFFIAFIFSCGDNNQKTYENNNNNLNGIKSGDTVEEVEASEGETEGEPYQPPPVSDDKEPEVLSSGDMELKEVKDSDGDGVIHTGEVFYIIGEGFDKEELTVTIDKMPTYITYRDKNTITAVPPVGLESGEVPLEVFSGENNLRIYVQATKLLYVTVDKPDDNLQIYSISQVKVGGTPVEKFFKLTPEITLSNSPSVIGNGNIGEMAVDYVTSKIFILRPELRKITVVDQSNFEELTDINLNYDSTTLITVPYLMSGIKGHLYVADLTNNRIHYYEDDDPYSKILVKDLPSGLTNPISLGLKCVLHYVIVGCAGTSSDGNNPGVVIYDAWTGELLHTIKDLAPRQNGNSASDFHYISVGADPFYLTDTSRQEVGKKPKYRLSDFYDSEGNFVTPGDPEFPASSPGNPKYNVLPGGLIFFTNNSKRHLYILDGSHFKNLDVKYYQTNYPTTTKLDLIEASPGRYFSGIDFCKNPSTPPFSDWCIPMVSATGLSYSVIIDSDVNLNIRVSSDAKVVYIYDKNDDGVMEGKNGPTVTFPRVVVVNLMDFSVTSVTPIDNQKFPRGFISPYTESLSDPIFFFMVGKVFQKNSAGLYLTSLVPTTGTKKPQQEVVTVMTLTDEKKEPFGDIE